MIWHPSRVRSVAAFVATLLFAFRAAAQDEPPVEPSPVEPPLVEPPLVESAPPPVGTLEGQEPRPVMSEGRTLVSLYNAGFQWGVSPGVVFHDGDAGFYLGLRLGYGFDLDTIIVVPGVRLAGYFLDPNVYVGMPVLKVVLPFGRFAPFVEGGVGYGHVSADDTNQVGSQNGLALLGGGGFMIHFPRIAFGAEAQYQVVTGTGFKGVGVGPILAIGF